MTISPNVDTRPKRAPTKPLTLNCIGAGRTGSTLCRLLSPYICISQIINRTEKSAQKALSFIQNSSTGALTASDFTTLKPADIWMITCPDDAISEQGKALLESNILRDGDTIFHCSGALSSAIFDSTGSTKINVASIHPIHSFAQPEKSLATFSGTYCALEGDDTAISLIGPLFESIGALLMPIGRENKVLYHLSTVTACNYLVSLLDLSQTMLSEAGISDIGNTKPLQGLIEKTVNNFFQGNAKTALTGPFARGDINTIAGHLNALKTTPPVWQEVYTSLGHLTLNIARTQGQLPEDNLAAIADLLDHAQREQNK
ncbi:MAG: DUF2520 domain-containing protein [Porticoccaceae bacterium]|nr:DUF2520 domain-containing protein [Porticoccaceae bacterium]MDG1474730.1 DUF2520 domain-containing protein [Porticoccaceae bacterium]